MGSTSGISGIQKGKKKIPTPTVMFCERRLASPRPHILEDVMGDVVFVGRFTWRREEQTQAPRSASGSDLM